MKGAGRQTKEKVLLGLVAVFLMCIVAYIPALQGGYIWDDDAYVKNNPTLRSSSGLRQIWFEIGATPQYYPMVHTSYWVEYRFWKLDPTGYHVVNVILHAIGAMLLWRVLRLLEVPGAWLAAAVFALHPVHVESVAWITERKNVLSGVFYFAAAWAYLKYALAQEKTSHRERSARFYVLSLILFLLALLSKTVTSTLPVVLLLLLWWKLKRLTWANLRSLAPFFVLGVTFGLLTAWMERGHVGAVGQEWNLSLVERCLVAGRALCFYTGRLFWPVRLTFVYPRWQIAVGSWPQYLYPAIAIGAMVLLYAARRRIGTGPLVAVLSFAATLLPALSFFNVYPMRYSFVADHFQYLASVDLIVLVVAVGHVAIGRLAQQGKIAGIIAAGLVLAALGTLTWRQGYVYKNLETLWRDTLAKNPHAWIAHNNLGHLVHLQGNVNDAINHYREAIRLKNDYSEAYNNLAWALATHPDNKMRQGNEAIRLAQRALELHQRPSPSILDTLAAAYASAGQFEQAVLTAEKALALLSETQAGTLANEIRKRLKLYQQGKSYRESVRNRDAIYQ